MINRVSSEYIVIITPARFRTLKVLAECVPAETRSLVQSDSSLSSFPSAPATPLYTSPSADSTNPTWLQFGVDCFLAPPSLPLSTAASSSAWSWQLLPGWWAAPGCISALWADPVVVEVSVRGLNGSSLEFRWFVWAIVLGPVSGRIGEWRWLCWR